MKHEFRDLLFGLPTKSIKDKINYLRHSFKWHKDEGFTIVGVTINKIDNFTDVGKCYFIDFIFRTERNINIYDRIVVGEFELKELNLPKITELFTTAAGNKHLISYIMGNETSLIKD